MIDWLNHWFEERLQAVDCDLWNNAQDQLVSANQRIADLEAKVVELEIHMDWVTKLCQASVSAGK